MGIYGREAERVRIERLEEVRKRLVAIEGKTVPSGKRPQFSLGGGDEKISYGIYPRPKRNSGAARPSHFVQCYASRYPRASFAVPVSKLVVVVVVVFVVVVIRGLVLLVVDVITSECDECEVVKCNILNRNIMTYGVSELLNKDSSVQMMHSKQHPSAHQQQNVRKSVGVMGSRRIFAPAFKLKVLYSYRNDVDCRGNQRATARKYGIHRRQIQKWLQCEETLRNSCAENGNTAAVSTSTTDSSASVSKPDGTVTETTGSSVTPAAPALNLSVARLHGDELTQQGPPPLPSHPPRSSAPSSPQYSLQTTTTNVSMCVSSVGYQQYSSPSEQQHHHRKLEDMVQVSETHGYPDTQVDQDRNYYVLNGEVRNAEAVTAFDGRKEVKVYQTMTNYHSPHQEHRYGTSDIDTSAHNHRHSPNHRPQSYEDVDSYEGKSYAGLLPAPSMIKTEPASPDSAATSGPYEPAGSPGGSWAPLSPVSHRAANSNGSSSLPVHFDRPASPYLDLHVHEHAHACPPPDSEKPIPSRLHQQERESEETTRHAEEKGEQKTLDEIEYSKTVIKEEVDLGEEQIHGNSDEGNTSSYIDVTGEPLVNDSGSISSAHDREGYSLPSSPRDPVSSSRSSSSWSDSEMDSVDCLPGNQNPPGNLARRRSFPLRFKLEVLDAFHRDAGVAGNQRATARKFSINRRQVQKWLGQETELRGEIALRGNSRQRLGHIQDGASGESPMDLRTMNYVSSNYNRPRDTEYESSSPHLYCCDIGSVPSQHLPYYQLSTGIEPCAEIEPIGSCNHSCCVDKQTTSTTSSYQDLSLKGSYTESPARVHCYSPRDYSEFSNLPEGEQVSPPLKRQSCTQTCCDTIPSPKRFCPDDTPPQDAPLCLVKPKRAWETSPPCMEPVTNIPIPSEPCAPQPSPSTSNKDDGILFKPYLDNPVCKPANEDVVQHSLSPTNRENNNNNDNNNCQSICNFNEGQDHDRSFQLNLQLPFSWAFPRSYTTEFQQVGSTFIRYPARNLPESSTCNFIFNPLHPNQTRTTDGHKLREQQAIDRVHTFRLQDALV